MDRGTHMERQTGAFATVAQQFVTWCLRAAVAIGLAVVAWAAIQAATTTIAHASETETGTEPAMVAEPNVDALADASLKHSVDSPAASAVESVTDLLTPITALVAPTSTLLPSADSEVTEALDLVTVLDHDGALAPLQPGGALTSLVPSGTTATPAVDAVQPAVFTASVPAPTSAVNPAATFGPTIGGVPAAAAAVPAVEPRSLGVATTPVAPLSTDLFQTPVAPANSGQQTGSASNAAVVVGELTLPEMNELALVGNSPAAGRFGWLFADPSFSPD